MIADKRALWTFSVVKDGQPHLVDVEQKGDELMPRQSTALLPDPVRIAGPLKDAPLPLTDDTIVARREGSDAIFYFTSTPLKGETDSASDGLKTMNAVSDEWVASGGMNAAEERLLAMVAREYGSDFMVAGDAERSPLLGALRESNKAALFKTVRQYPQEDADELEKVIGIVLKMDIRNVIEKNFAGEFIGALYDRPRMLPSELELAAEIRRTANMQFLAPKGSSDSLIGMAFSTDNRDKLAENVKMLPQPGLEAIERILDQVDANENIVRGVFMRNMRELIKATRGG